MNLPPVASFLRWLALFFDPNTRATVAALELRLEELRREQAELQRERWS